MEIKRKFTKAINRLSPQIEAMNVAHEMGQMADRLNELLDYAEEKIQRSASRGGESMGLRIARERGEEQQSVAAIQRREEIENLEDQQQNRAQPESAATPEEREERHRLHLEEVASKKTAKKSSSKKSKKKGRRSKASAG
jgi:hypothetical protein